MTLPQLLASRKLWRSREVYRYKKWHFYRYSSKRPLNERTALRSKWYKQYVEARDMRRRRDVQIAKARNAAHTVSDAGVALVAQFESFRSHPYQDAGGVWTIGYGETLGVGPHTPPVSEAQAKTMLRKRLNGVFLHAVLAANKHLEQEELDGFASFTYNCGPGAVSAASKVGKYLRANKIRQAADALLEWVRGGGRVLPGLVVRRKAERALIL